MLEGRIVVITHARHFVGPSTARVLTGYGARVICHDGNPDPGIVTAEASEPEALIDEVIAGHGRIDALICNDAHPALRAPVDEADPREMRAALEALVEWPYRLIGRAVPAMKTAGSGRIVMVTSAAPLRGLANYSIYATARGAGNALVKSLSLELAPFNIQINAIAPNYIENPTYFPPELLANDKAMAKMLANIPMKRLGKPDEVAETIAFLASGRCGFITGHVVPIAGGWA
ncbi:MAG: SDR family oxidoreductase [Alphaproteobacteria bacterium]